jgi:hypothetical protein
MRKKRTGLARYVAFLVLTGVWLWSVGSVETTTRPVATFVVGAFAIVGALVVLAWE